MESARFFLTITGVALFAAAVTTACGGGNKDNVAGQQDPGGVPTLSSQISPTVVQTPAANPGPQMTDPSLKVQSIPGVESPTQMAFIGNDDLLVTTKPGKVLRVRGGKVEGTVLQLKANYADERGVLGIATHPNFAQNGWVYIYWTWTGEGTAPGGLLGNGSDNIEAVPAMGNRIDRFRWDGSKLTFDRNIIQLPSRTTDLTLNRRRGNHDAGVIQFGPDGKLYAVIGDQNARNQLQNVAGGEPPTAENLLGVILRLNDDGTSPADNPFASMGEPMAKVWVYGLRNSFGYAFDPATGNFWLETNGQASYDQIGMYRAGDNVGWIQLMGPPDRFQDYKALEQASERLLDNPVFPPARLANSGDEAISRLVMFPGATYRQPKFAWKRAVAPTTIQFLGKSLGGAYEGDMLVGDVNTGSIYRFKLTPDRTDIVLQGGLADRVNDNSKEDLLGELSGQLFATNMFVVTDIAEAPDGSLWITSAATGLFRVSP